MPLYFGSWYSLLREQCYLLFFKFPLSENSSISTGTLSVKSSLISHRKSSLFLALCFLSIGSRKIMLALRYYSNFYIHFHLFLVAAILPNRNLSTLSQWPCIIETKSMPPRHVEPGMWQRYTAEQVIPSLLHNPEFHTAVSLPSGTAATTEELACFWEAAELAKLRSLMQVQINKNWWHPCSQSLYTYPSVSYAFEGDIALLL